MHNSIHIRPMLLRANQEPMRLERRDPHRLLMPDPQTVLGTGDFALEGAWSIRHSSQPAADLVQADLIEFFSRMGILYDPNSPKTLSLIHQPNLPERAFRLVTSPQSIEIHASAPAGLWAGHAWLEWHIRTRRGAFLPHLDETRNPGWGIQISQGPWGGNYSVPDFSPEYLSDDAFRLYAHYGINSMMIYGDLLCYANSLIFPELNCADYATNISTLKDAATRAARYGVRFSYVVVGPKLGADHPLFQRCPTAKGSGILPFSGGKMIHCLCSSDETVLSFYAETFESLFHKVPELVGLILIVAGESYYHCHMWRHAQAPCPRCSQEETEEGIARLLEVTADAVHKSSPSAFVVAWPYTTAGWERPDALRLIDKLPSSVGLYNHIEKDQLYVKDGYSKWIWDYSVDYTGPSDSILARAARARQRGLDLFVKTETGIGLEVFQYPYVPAMQRLARKWKAVRDLNPQGVLQSWLFFGMFGSRAEELGAWAAYAPDIPVDTFLKAISTRDFGPAAAGLVVESWEAMSEAVGHIPCITLYSYYQGPSYLGPCHPLVPRKDDPIPDAFWGALYYLQEGDETFSHKNVDAKINLVMSDLTDNINNEWGVAIQCPTGVDGWEIITREYDCAAANAKLAWEKLLHAAPLASTSADRTLLQEEILLTELIYRTFVSCSNTVKFIRQRNAFEQNGNPEHRQRMAQIARNELRNAESAIPIYQQAPWLDLSARTDGIFTPCIEMIRVKNDWIRQFLAAME